ncbi:MAG TPA: ankyrin repeat domain-containing protein [Polyangiaceae bacterium]|nr:ankyrin repeat domain-containing protein [Polyangiaceae bacterium]
MTAPASPRFRRIDARRAADLIVRHRRGVLPELALYDVRDAKSFDHSHVEGAERLDDRGLADTLQRLPRRTLVIVYCYHGNASQAYAATFADFRYTEVYSVDGGFEPLARALAEREPPDQDAPAQRDISDALAAFLCAHDFDPQRLDSPRKHGLTPLMRAALEGRTDLVEELLRLGVDVNLRNADGNTALWLACVSNDLSVVQRLLDARIVIDGQNDAGATALMYAASAGKERLVERLLRAGADPGLRNQDDFTALDLASTWACVSLLRPRLPL